jgi:hypothetical protein
MTGLVPVIRVVTFKCRSKTITSAAAAESVEVLQPASPVTTWMPGTRPRMTLKALCKSLKLAPMGETPAVPGGRLLHRSKIGPRRADIPAANDRPVVQVPGREFACRLVGEQDV